MDEIDLQSILRSYPDTPEATRLAGASAAIEARRDCEVTLSAPD
jgi:hypothetical protein